MSVQNEIGVGTSLGGDLEKLLFSRFYSVRISVSHKKSFASDGIYGVRRIGEKAEKRAVAVAKQAVTDFSAQLTELVKFTGAVAEMDKCVRVRVKREHPFHIIGDSVRIGKNDNFSFGIFHIFPLKIASAKKMHIMSVKAKLERCDYK